jgi:protein-tyrosine phosphatase
MPLEDQIEDLAKIFKAVVILVEEWELDYDLQLWTKFGVNVKHLPIPDFGTPGLSDLQKVMEWIKREIEFSPLRNATHNPEF